MKVRSGLREQVKRVAFIVLTGWLTYLIITGLIIGIGYFVYNIPVGDFTREPNVTLNGAVYIGAISNLGICLWTAAATVCFFGVIYLKRYNPDSSFRTFLLHAGIFTTLLLLDDLFQLHENIGPVYLHINQKISYIVYLGYGLFFLIKFRQAIFKTEYIIFLTSIFLLSLSILVDFIDESKRLTHLLDKLTGFNMHKSEDMRIFLEDTFKGLGILTWLIYFYRVALVNVFSPAKNSEREIPVQK